ncbi:MarR family transcriptional regulator [Nonomuraea phyllanthi]|uniref:MarR family transcriptional regulator n=1 Tax=Nonomuraea phyllanthi TaxID=2219224 RepID=A0A5C4WMQ5_9ACTN|nr:MarR family winged helix-turn-helix transcriptional regulator [Nonomuraea phyllanthi]KAB8194602.1 MarR family transcriptional regulator [Nonomuraea phyllanthi]QFY09026.1 MarR family transcriptional regulator [Nonomuraea phyllanthi]
MTSPPAADQSQCRSGPLLDHLARRIRMRSESVLGPLGLRPRHLVTLTVLRDGGACTQQNLAAVLEMDGTNVVGLLNDLEAQQLIERRRAPHDRRRHVVQLTEIGEERLAYIETQLAAVEEDVLGKLDIAQRDALYALLQQAVSNSTIVCTENVEDC